MCEPFVFDKNKKHIYQGFIEDKIDNSTPCLGASNLGVQIN